MESIQTEEISRLKSVFEDQVKVISNIGDFTHVVTFQPRDLDLHCKFQLLDDYPKTPPTIIVRSQQMSPEQIQDMVTRLEETAKSKPDTCVLNELMDQCLKLVNDLELDLTQQVVKPKSKSVNPKSKNKKQKAPKSESEAQPKGKKPPMKTAAEVIKRLQWDEAVNKEDFIVGYMDRLTGLEEKPFTDFTWEDLATVDPYCLAIPQHRIQFFKYIDEKVWDKNERLDNVFGSTGSKLTLPEAIQKYHESRQERGIEADNKQPDQQVCETNEDVREKERKPLETRKEKSGTNLDSKDAAAADDDDDCDEDDGGGDEDSKSDARDSSTEGGQPKKDYKFNYFIALQITNPKLITKLVQVQKELVKDNPMFEPFQIPKETFHLTLNAMKLTSSSDVIQCVSALKNMKYDLLKLTKAAGKIYFDGLGHFSNRVIYAKIKLNQGFQELVDTIKYNLAMADIKNEVKTSFTPHLTLFKMDWEYYNDLRKSGFWIKVRMREAESMLGYQPVDNISLCAMGGRSEKDGFYLKAYEFNLADYDFEL